MVGIRREPDVEWTFEGGPNYLSVQEAPTGTEPVINEECMLVHRKVDDSSI